MSIKALLLANVLQLSVVVALVASWLAFADKAPPSRVVAIGAAAFAGTFGLALATLSAMS